MQAPRSSLEGDVAARMFTRLNSVSIIDFVRNIVSFREPSNPWLAVYPAKPEGNDKHNRRCVQLAAFKPDVNVVYENKQLQAVSSANGRVNLSIST
jgi:hypothetical protein